MIDHVTDSQIASYQEDGFLVVEGLLQPSELEHWRGVIDQAVARFNGKIFDLLLPVFYEIIRNPAVISFHFS